MVEIWHLLWQILRGTRLLGPGRARDSALARLPGADFLASWIPVPFMMLGSKKERNLSMRFQSGQKSSVHGVEYAFGAHDYSVSGVFEVEPRQCPGFKFRKSICMGTTCLDPLQIREFMEIQLVNYNGDTYHLISKNCNHFCEDICKRLTGNLIPKWVNRLARMGAVCNCILPEPLKINAARYDPGCQAEDIERKMLTGSFSCFSSISLCQRHFSTSSLSRGSPTEGASWDTKQSNSTRLKKS
ncbi:deSI-like protein sdu1 isoform X4 [Miscanthus floridulus]|uniref:deSI-like protein sdu1 isoform X4 n=1 Tax=Miscanthus floridulus TaxID=154761 RepID=UPI003458BF1D